MAEQKKKFMNDTNGNRKDNKTIERDKQLMNLRYNLLLIREAYRMMHASKTSMGEFYEALGVTDDVYSIFLNGSTISPNQHKQLVDVLTSCGINKKYLSTTRPPKIFATSDLKEYADEYFNADVKSVKTEALSNILAELKYNWLNNNPDMAMLICGVYILSTKISGTTESDLYFANDILDKLMLQNFSNNTLNSRAFASFITSLAKTINKIELDFPDFYAVAQQIKNQKTPESIMNEITHNLELLNSMRITKTIATSESCLNMLGQISDIMLKISDKFN